MNNEMILQTKQLPDTLDELASFVMFSEEKLQAVRAGIRAMDKLNMAQEVLEQKRHEAQDLAELVIDSEVRLGEMLKALPKNTNNNPTGNNQHGGQNRTPANLTYPKDDGERIEEADKAKNAFLKPKQKILEELGIKKDTAARLQTLADNKPIVEAAKAKARENDDIISKSFALKEIESEKKGIPHIAYNSGNNEWYTPQEFIEAARECMGSIDLDPASSEIANKVVKAERYFTPETDGLLQSWHGNVFLNPPYASDLVGQFIAKLLTERGNYEQAVVLVNNATETQWFKDLVSISSCICFPTGRVKFYKPDGEIGAPLQGQAIAYIGDNAERFTEKFRGFGWIAKIIAE